MHEKETKKKQILAKLESHISKPKRNLSWFGKDPKQPCSASPQRGANRPAITAQCTAYKPVEQHSQTAKGTRGLLKQVTCRCKLKPTCKKNNRTQSRWKNYTTKTETIPKHDVQNTRKFLGPCFTCAHFALGLACGAPRQNCLVTKGVFSRIRHVQETVFILVFVVNLRHE